MIAKGKAAEIAHRDASVLPLRFAIINICSDLFVSTLKAVKPRLATNKLGQPLYVRDLQFGQAPSFKDAGRIGF